MTIQELEKLIIEASNAYYHTEYPIMSDEEFDSLVLQLKSLDPNNVILTTPNWGSSVNNRHLIERDHTFLVGGLPKYKSVDFNLNDLPEDTLLTSKLDGISAVAYYSGGKLKYVLTRNDGKTGFDITDKVQYAKIPKTVPDSSLTWVRGELVLKVGTAEKYGKSNERNMVAGLANSVDLTLAHKEIEFIAYDCNFGKSIHTLALLNMLGFDVVRLALISKTVNYSKVEHIFDYSAFDIDYPYLIDGVVVTNPEGDSVAVKYPNRKYKAVVVKVHNQISDRGRVIPVIEIEPIKIDGVTVTYCTGHNYQHIKNLQIGKGAIVEISRSNEVIPYLNGVIEKGEYEEPYIIDNKLAYWEGVHLFVETDKLKSSIYALINFKSPKGLAQSRINQFINYFGIKEYNDLANLLNTGLNQDDLIAEFGAFSKHINELLENMKKGWTISEMLKSTFSRGLGDVASLSIQDQYSSDFDLLLVDLQTIGNLPENIKVPTKTVREGISENLDLIVNLLSSQLPKLVEKLKVKEGLIPICLTGKLSAPRSKLLEEWKDVAFEVDIGKAQYLITDNPNSGSSKNKKAEKLGIKVLTESEFRSIIEK